MQPRLTIATEGLPGWGHGLPQLSRLSLDNADLAFTAAVWLALPDPQFRTSAWFQALRYLCLLHSLVPTQLQAKCLPLPHRHV